LNNAARAVREKKGADAIQPAAVLASARSDLTQQVRDELQKLVEKQSEMQITLNDDLDALQKSTHFVTTRKKFWGGETGLEPFGSPSMLIQGIRDLAHNKDCIIQKPTESELDENAQRLCDEEKARDFHNFERRCDEMKLHHREQGDLRRVHLAQLDELDLDA